VLGGFEQVEGIDYYETFAPVVIWLTVRLLLIMSILLELETTQIDYTAAFVHADIDCLVYVAMPPGFGIPGQVWKLQKSLYGLAQSPHNYFLYTRDKPIKMGFVQSKADPCLFISSDIICLIYVNDALLFYKDKSSITALVNKMKQEGILFREEESVAGYLGVHMMEPFISLKRALLGKFSIIFILVETILTLLTHLALNMYQSMKMVS
jgi:hypothetical protein